MSVNSRSVIICYTRGDYRIDIMVKATAKNIFPQLQMIICLIAFLLSGCVTQSFEDNEPVVKTQANRDEMAATRISLGLGYLKMGDMSQAKLNLEKAKRFSPNLVQVHTAFAHYYETVGESDLAIVSFEEALAIEANSADTLNNYGVFLCRQNQVDAAETQFLKAIAVPSYLLVAQSYENLASCYLQNDNFEKAEMYLNKTIAHNPNRISPLLQMVRLKYAMGNFKEARVYLQRFERNTQRFSADSLSLSYKVYRKLGQRRTANNYGNMLVKMYPQSWEGKQFLLNGLEFIEADNLANKYQLSQKQKNPQRVSSNNKRVVKLSPKSKRINNPNKSIASEVTLKKVKTPDLNEKLIQVDNNIEKILAAELASKEPEIQAIGTTTIASATSSISTAIPSTEAITGLNKVSSTAVATTSALLAVNNDKSEKINIKAKDESLLSIDNTVQLSKEQSEILLVANDVNTKTAISVLAVEPTSTQPIPAERDVPLPKALPIPTEVVVSEVNANKELATGTLDKPLNKIDATSTNVVFHNVSEGENLYNISVKYNTKLSTLRKWNNISEKNTIRVNQKIYVVDPDTVNNINE